MVSQFEKEFEKLRESEEIDEKISFKAVVGNLLDEQYDPKFNTVEYHDFDVAAVGLGFHHFENPGLALHRLAERVVRGSGIVLIIDWLPGGGHSHGTHEDGQSHSHHQHHHGHGDSHDHEHGHKHQEDPHVQLARETGAHHTIKTHGFTETDMRKLFEEAGCTNFGFSIMEEPVFLEFGDPPRRTPKSIFIARGTRA